MTAWQVPKPLERVNTKNAALVVEEFRTGVLVSGFSLEFSQPARRVAHEER
jgi:hypothetical protein